MPGSPCDWRTPWDDVAAATATDPLSRRHILRATVGGVALATSGLVLPAWVIAASAAGEHPVRNVQDRADKRRQRRRRHHNNTKDQTRPNSPYVFVHVTTKDSFQLISGRGERETLYF